MNVGKCGRVAETAALVGASGAQDRGTGGNRGDLDLSGRSAARSVEHRSGGIQARGDRRRVGKIDEATYETDGSYLVVDTGQWILGRKVMIPAGVVERVDTEEERVYVDLTKEEIKSSPEFEPDRHRDDSEYRRRLSEYYGRT
jgi:hypothetical protein